MPVSSRHADWCRRSGGLAVALSLILSACGTGETDPNDDLGAPADTPVSDDTRVELIFVDAESDSLTGPGDIEPTSPPSAPSAADEVGGDDLLTFAADGEYTVQVGVFKNSQRASRRVRELEALGYPAYAIAHPTGDQVRVRIGYFSGKDEADRFGQRFCRDHGGKYWVDRRRAEEEASR